MEREWKRPVLTLYAFEKENPSSSPIVVLKARKMTITYDDLKAPISGKIVDFFPLMGSIDLINTKNGREKQYVLCWHEDENPDFFNSQRKLVNVRFTKSFEEKSDEKGKRSFSGEFMV